MASNVIQRDSVLLAHRLSASLLKAAQSGDKDVGSILLLHA